jgi:Zn-dependent M28 family amino/carboxypeptidase
VTPFKLLAAFLAACMLGCSGSDATDPFTPAGRTAAAQIDDTTIRDVVAEIASDRYEGRAPGTAGDTLTQRYLIAQLETMGFAPGAADGGWLQPFDLVSLTAQMPDVWAFRSDENTVALQPQQDYVAASGVQANIASIDDAELVFVGYGIEAPEYRWDDFKGVDVRGKVLVMLNNDPDWDPNLFAGVTRLYYGRWTYKYEVAAAHGAAGAIIIHTTPSAGYPWQVVQSSWSGPQFQLPAAGEPRIAVQGWVTEDAATRMLAAAGHSLERLVEQARRRDFTPVSLGLRTSLTMPVAMSATQTANVIGVLEGSDPQLEDEYVIYTAHHDHLGIGAPNPNGDPDDRIYNGAQDNATGVGIVMAIGNGFAALEPRPRRSIMLLFVGAEEQGLLGSAYFAAHPTMPAGRIAANINYDSGNIWGAARDILFIGLGKSSLDTVAQRVAIELDRVVKPDEFPDRGSYYRSDQFSFAKVGVPALYLDGGSDIIGQPRGWGVDQINAYTDTHYHQPSDELREDWRFDGMVDDARFGFWAGLIVANDDAMPTWYPGDEFEAARATALDAKAD